MLKKSIMFIKRPKRQLKLLLVRCGMLILFSLMFNNLTAQSKEMGLPFIRNFTSAEYGAHTQNFTISQDTSGILYFGNFVGILKYDGNSWETIYTQNNSKVSALKLGPDGKIYVGARGEIGVLEKDTIGKLFFQSLNNNIPAEYRNFTDIHGICCSQDNVYFVSGHRLFAWNKSQIKVWDTERKIIAAFFEQGRLYLQLSGFGLSVLDKDQLNPVSGGEIFGSVAEIKSMVSDGPDKLLLVTDHLGLFSLKNNVVYKKNIRDKNIFKKNTISCGVVLSDSTIMLGTVQNGLMLISASGELISDINERTGLTNNFVNELFIDSDKNLWAALNNGLAILEIPSPLTFFNEDNYLEGGVTDILRFHDTLFVSTYQGLYWFDDEVRRFRKIPGITTACWSLAEAGGQLLAGASQGVYLIRKLNPVQISRNFSLCLYPSESDKNIVYVGLTDGIVRLIFEHGRWHSSGALPGIIGEVRNIVEDSGRFLWFRIPGKGIFRYEISNEDIINIDTTFGLPAPTGNYLNKVGEKLLISTKKGVFVYNPKNQIFTPCNWFKNDSLQNNRWFKLIVADSQDNLWVNEGDETHPGFFARSPEGIFTAENTALLPVKKFITWEIYPDKDRIIWFGGPNGLIRFNTKVRKNYIRDFPVFLNKITIGKDSVIQGGEQVKNIYSPVVIGKKFNNILFGFASPQFDVNGTNQFRYILEGHDETWSIWTDIPRKEYSNLPKGQYVFRVKAKNIYNCISRPASFGFRILPLWYQTVWAFIFFILLTAALVFLIVRIRSRQLLKEKRILEEKIEERTAEIVQQKEEIEQQSVLLSEKNIELGNINTVVKSINSEIHFLNLLQSLLEKTRMIKAVEKATALVYDAPAKVFQFKASSGWEIRYLDKFTLTLEEAEERYLKGALEVYEDIFLKNKFDSFKNVPSLQQLPNPKSMLVLVIKIDNRVEAFLILENTSRQNAFDTRDLGFIKNLKEHIISAFIKTKLLQDIQKTLDNLKAAQVQLVQSEKLASLGELTAGIAHEIQNPLNFVNNFSTLSIDLSDELKEILEEIKENPDKKNFDDIEEIISMIEGNMRKISEHGKRAESIVKGMLQHSRGSSGEFELTDINNMVSEDTNLAYHGMRAKNRTFNVTLKNELDPDVGKIKVVPQDISRVILNVLNNACFAVNEKANKNKPGYSPEIFVGTKKIPGYIIITIRDNGTGIPEHVKEKIFNPFFTTKPTGKGTGLGLSMSYDILTQIHKGKIQVNTKEGEFTEFVITIPDNLS